MTEERQVAGMPANPLSTKRGFPVYRTNPSVPQVNGLPTWSKRINVPGGKASVIVDIAIVKLASRIAPMFRLIIC